eukprot:jgi/Ulvmu1/6850/UM031_0055.1
MVLSESFRASRHLDRCRKVRLARNTRRAREEISSSCPKERCPVEDMAVYTQTEAHACHALNDVLWHCERAHLGHQPTFASRLPPLSTCILTAGLDVEYSKQRRERLPKPALLQLATPDFVIVIPLGVLHKSSLNLGTEPRGSAVMMLQKLMDTPYIEKVGVGIDDDVKALKRFFTTLDLDLPTQGVMDLRHMSAELGFGRPGLKEMGARVLGYTIQKGRHCGDWEHSALTPDQLQYACDDAWLSQKLGLELKNRCIASTAAAAALMLPADNTAAEQAQGGSTRRCPHMFDLDEAARQRKHICKKRFAMESTDLPDRFLGTHVDSVPRAPQVGWRLLQLALDSIPWIPCLGIHARRPRRRPAASRDDGRQSAMLHAGHSPMKREGLTRSKPPARNHSSHTSYPRSATVPGRGQASVSSVPMTRQACSADPKLDLWCGRACRGSPSGDARNQGGESLRQVETTCNVNHRSMTLDQWATCACHDVDDLNARAGEASTLSVAPLLQ